MKIVLICFFLLCSFNSILMVTIGPERDFERGRPCYRVADCKEGYCCVNRMVLRSRQLSCQPLGDPGNFCTTKANKENKYTDACPCKPDLACSQYAPRQNICSFANGTVPDSPSYFR
uniref:Prokineticin domain-containing protein n=1 Tax=Tetranychus urticae TaxID=32264 RepID=T1KG57_TETUR